MKKPSTNTNVTKAQTISVLKSLGVVIETTKTPYTKDSKNTSVMGNYDKRIVMK